MALLQLDEDVPYALIAELSALGHDVLSPADARVANRGIPDGAILERARSDGRILITTNRRDFRRLHRSGVAHAGILLVSTKLGTRSAERIDAVLSA